jgi:hypothetical protein
MAKDISKFLGYPNSRNHPENFPSRAQLNQFKREIPTAIIRRQKQAINSIEKAKKYS